MREIVLPYLAELGDRWERGDASIAQQHFASNLIRGRLTGPARDWGYGSGPRTILFCPPGERHDLALMIFGVTLNGHGWRIDYLGADTPVEELTRTAAARPPDLVVLAATQPGTLEPLTAALARTAPLALAGAGAAPQLAAAGAGRLAFDPIMAAVTIGWPPVTAPAASYDGTSWRESAACRSYDSEFFFPIGKTGRATAEIRRAKAVCAACPVRAECLAFALETHQDYGIWGGCDEDERRALRRQRRRVT